MSNLSRELFRGLMTDKVREPLGMHWSSEESGAKLFASPEEEGEKHTIVRGQVNQGDIMTGYNEEFMKQHQILSTGWPEYEEPVEPGSTVKVTGLTKIRKRGGVKKTREIKFNPPRKMKA